MSDRRPWPVELNGVRIWAVPYRGRRAGTPRKLVCGSLVDVPTEAQRSSAPDDLPASIPLPSDPEVSIRLCGLFLLPTGDVAAVYGAAAEPLGGSIVGPADGELGREPDGEA